MPRTWILTAAALAACSPSTEDPAQDLLATYDHELDELQEAADTYVAAVATATDVDAVSDLQTTYDSDADHAIEGIEHTLDDIEGCSHMGNGAAKVIEARSSLQAMHDDIEAVLAIHPMHQDLTDCVAIANSHAETIQEELTKMAAHHDAWDGMTCEMHDDEHTHD